MSGRARVRAVEVAQAAALLLGVALAPVVGDIGGCGQAAEDLDASKFFSAKSQIDCAQCDECGLASRACEASCDLSPEGEFPPGCYPLIHDGEACLHALQVASCADYADYMADEGASTPTECNFCPPDEAP